MLAMSLLDRNGARREQIGAGTRLRHVPHGMLLQDVAQRGAQARGHKGARALQAPVR